jgi:outer membrane protein OmpA-like peptidoglycan-associated protein
MSHRSPRLLARRFACALAAPSLFVLSSACAAGSGAGPSRDLRLQHVVLYQNGIGYFERTGVMTSERLRLQFREREVDDVLKSLVVVEAGLSPNEKPSTVSALLPQNDPKKAPLDAEDTTFLDLVLSPATSRSVSIAYAVPTAAWKATYRVILPDATQKSSPGALLQAWALIDNVSDEDWSGVKLTLATGAPLSYTSNLRAPRFVRRPEARSDADEPVLNGPVAAERTREADRDADGIADSSDVCPADPGAPSTDASKNGCPQFVRRIVSESNLVILQQVVFNRDSDAIRADSQPILSETAKMLKGNPEIRALTIEGHSSSDERDPWGLAARRAGAVQAALRAQGVTCDLNVKSFGDTRPIESGSTDFGRQKNRRIEFHIERTGAAAGGEDSGAARAKDMSRTPSVSSAPKGIAGTIRYDITHSVSIPRRSSTLVTIINEYMPGEDIFLFRPDPAAPASSTYPFRAARIENKGNLGLQPGAVSIFAGGTFVGEGILDRLNPGDIALIPYALDSSASVRVTSEEAEQPVRILALNRGVMSVENSFSVTTRYEITPGKQAPSRIYLRHERREGYEVKRLPPGTETTSAAHLMPIPIQPGKPSVLAIEEVQPRRREISVFSAEGAKLGLYLQGSALPPDVEKQVRELISLRVEFAKIEDELTSLRDQLNDAVQRSAELRESIRALEKTPRAAALQQKLVERLAEATGRTDKLSTKLADRSAAQAEVRARLSESLRELRIAEKPPATGEKK